MMGGRLVERQSRQIYLTTLGQDLLERAQKILLDVDELNDLVRAADGPLAGRLRLGIIPTIAPYLLADMITTLSERYPGLEVQPRESVTKALIDDLHASHLDVAVVALPLSEGALEEFALFDEDFVLVRPAMDANNPVPNPETLRHERLLLLEEGHCFRDQALSFCDLRGVRPRYLMEGSSLSTLVQMVGAGMGVTLIPEMALALESRTAGISIARFAAPAPSRKVGLVWRKTNPLAAHLIEVGAAIRQIWQGPRGR